MELTGRACMDLVSTVTSAASRDELCVYPVNGWWQKSKHQRLSRESPKPYSLVISLTLLDRPDVDIYSVISQRLEQVNVVEITQ